MAIGRYGVNDAAAVKVWAKTVEYEALKATPIGPLIGDSPDSIIHRKDELTKGPGDRVRYTLFRSLEGDGVTEGQTLLGNEESLENYTDDLLINELMHAAKVPNDGRSIDSQRVVYNLRDTARRQLRDWFAQRLSVAFFNAVCGNVAQTNTKYTGQNATIAPSSGRQIWAGTATTDETLTTADTFTMDMVYAAKTVAQTASPKVKPIHAKIMNKDGGEASDSADVLEEIYCMYLHPNQVFDLKRDMSDGEWFSIQSAALAGGKISNNPIFNGSLGMVDGVLLKRADDIPLGVNSTTDIAVANTRRAVLLGAQAACYARSAGGGSQRFRWVEELLDYERVLGVSLQSIWGLKKTQFNSVDYGTIVVSTYAASPA